MRKEMNYLRWFFAYQLFSPAPLTGFIRLSQRQQAYIQPGSSVIQRKG